MHKRNFFSRILRREKKISEEADLIGSSNWDTLWRPIRSLRIFFLLPFDKFRKSFLLPTQKLYYLLLSYGIGNNNRALQRTVEYVYHGQKKFPDRRIFNTTKRNQKGRNKREQNELFVLRDKKFFFSSLLRAMFKGAENKIVCFSKEKKTNIWRENFRIWPNACLSSYSMKMFFYENLSSRRQTFCFYFFFESAQNTHFL